jgi:hypothetical protein
LISDSGAAGLVSSGDTAKSNFTFLAGQVGCGGLNDTAELACMRGVNASFLENTLSNYIISGAKPSISFTPFPDNKTAFSNPSDRASRGLVAKIVSIFYLFIS